jgi:hypothetical protein
MADGDACMCAAGCVQGIDADPQPYHAAARSGPAAVCMRSFSDRWCVACQTNQCVCLLGVTRQCLGLHHARLLFLSSQSQQGAY